jgi:hypothetical protein
MSKEANDTKLSFLFIYLKIRHNNVTIKHFKVKGMKLFCRNLSMVCGKRGLLIIYSENLRLILLFWSYGYKLNPGVLYIGNLLNSLVAWIKNDFCHIEVLEWGSLYRLLFFRDYEYLFRISRLRSAIILGFIMVWWRKVRSEI